jgi:hypothetical protein
MVQVVQTEVTKKQPDEIAALSVAKERTSMGCISKTCALLDSKARTCPISSSLCSTRAVWLASAAARATQL